MKVQEETGDRLLFMGNSDTHRKRLTCPGYRRIAVAVFWGSPRHRKLAFHLTVDWKEGSKAPTFEIIRGEGIVRTDK
jgi:hypothetical protein